MNIGEYNKVKDMTYLEYCDYLQGKYGIGLSDYMTKSFNKNQKVTRTKEGLVAHHKMEDRMILLSNPQIACNCPFEWQKKENIVYCDYLEHLFLHVLICKYPSAEKEYIVDVGIGGVVNFIVPELNDLYSGWQTAQSWRQNCHDKVRHDKDVYLAILKDFIAYEKEDRNFDIKSLFTSFNEEYGTWSRDKNKTLYKEIKKLA